MHLNFKISIVFSSVLFLTAQGLKAQQITLSADTVGKEKELSEVVLAASKFAQLKQEVVQQFHVIGNKKISQYNQQTTAELLQQSGQVLVQKSQLGGGSPIIRGFEANKVLIVIDGVRMNNAIYRGGHLQNVLSIDNASLERVELLFGPSSSVYGSDALGGVMSFNTLTPSFASGKKPLVKLNAFARYASAYDEKTVHADFSLANQKLASLTSITYSNFGDLRQGSDYFNDFPSWGRRSFVVERIAGTDSMVKNSRDHYQKSSAYEQYDLLQKFLFNTGKIRHQLNFQFSNTGNVNRYDRLTETNAAGKAKSAEWYYGPAQRLMLAWTMELPKTSLYEQGKIILSAQDIEESRHNRNYRSVKLNHRIENVHVYALNADFKKAYKKGDFRYGAELIYNKVKSTARFENIENGSTGKLDTRYPDGGSNTQSYALYLNNTHKLSKYFIAQAGIRGTISRLYSAFNDTSFFPFPYHNIEQRSANITGNAGINFLPGDGWKISALVATGFRTPNVDDLSKVFESGAGTLVVPNPNIKPERTINYEIGISKYKTGKYFISTTAWYTNYSNVLTVADGTFNGADSVFYNNSMSKVVSVVNKSKAYLYGVSMNGSVSFCRHFSAEATFNYTYGRIREQGKKLPLDHIAPVFGKVSLNYKASKFGSEIFMLYNGAKDSSNYKTEAEDNEVYSADPVRGFTPAWMTFNSRLSYQLSRVAIVQLAVENIFDKFYRVFASGISAPGRNLSVTLRIGL